MHSDMERIRHNAATREPATFDYLVQRHVGMVYAVSRPLRDGIDHLRQTLPDRRVTPPAAALSTALAHRTADAAPPRRSSRHAIRWQAQKYQQAQRCQEPFPSFPQISVDE